jgi:hypothetical protein
MKSLTTVVAGLLVIGLVPCACEASDKETNADSLYNQALRNDPYNLEKAAQLYASAIRELEQKGPRDERYATCLTNLAVIEFKGNDLTGAEGHIKRSLEASQDPYRAAQNYQMLGDIQAHQDKLREAEASYNSTCCC